MPTCRASPTTASNSPSACWRTPTWRRRRASISIRSAADTSSASATRARRRRCTKRWSGSRPGSNREGAREGGIMSELLVLRRPRPPAIVPPLLSFTAGFIDSFTVLALFGLFVAQVTGSFVLTAVAIVTNEPGALTKLLAIPVFLLAAVATTVLAVMLERRGRAALAWVLGLECAALTGLLLTALIGAPLADPNAATVTAASLLGLFAWARRARRCGC